MAEALEMAFLWWTCGFPNGSNAWCAMSWPADAHGAVATRRCEKLIAAGGACVVLRNGRLKG